MWSVARCGRAVLPSGGGEHAYIDIDRGLVARTTSVICDDPPAASHQQFPPQPTVDAAGFLGWLAARGNVLSDSD